MSSPATPAAATTTAGIDVSPPVPTGVTSAAARMPTTTALRPGEGRRHARPPAQPAQHGERGQHQQGARQEDRHGRQERAGNPAWPRRRHHAQVRGEREQRTRAPPARRRSRPGTRRASPSRASRRRRRAAAAPRGRLRTRARPPARGRRGTRAPGWPVTRAAISLPTTTHDPCRRQGQGGRGARRGSPGRAWPVPAASRWSERLPGWPARPRPGAAARATRPAPRPTISDGWMTATGTASATTAGALRRGRSAERPASGAEPSQQRPGRRPQPPRP